MDTSFLITIIEKAAGSFQMRLFEGNAPTPVSTRELPVAKLDELLKLVDSDYKTDPAGLVRLGKLVAAFLDGAADRWLGLMTDRAKGSFVLRLDVDQRLRHIPWELLNVGGLFLTTAVHGQVAPVRRAGTSSSDPRPPANRPFHVLFMECSA